MQLLASHVTVRAVAEISAVQYSTIQFTVPCHTMYSICTGSSHVIYSVPYNAQHLLLLHIRTVRWRDGVQQDENKDSINEFDYQTCHSLMRSSIYKNDIPLLVYDTAYSSQNLVEITLY